MKRILIAVLFGIFAVGAQSAELSPTLPEILELSQPTDQIAVIAFLDHKLSMDEVYPEAKALPMGPRRDYVVRALKERFAQMSPDVMKHLEGYDKSGVSLLRPLWIINAIRVTATPDVIRRLASDFAEVIYVAHDPIYENTLDIGWGVFETGAPQVWAQFGARGQGVIVGHKDSGITFAGCPRFDGRIWFNPGEDLNGNGTLDAGEINGVDDDGNGYADDFYGWNFDSNDNNVSDNNGHGSKTGSVISSNHSTSSCDTVCMAPDATLMILKGYETQGAVLESSQYAVSNGAHVISASLSFKQNECVGRGECPNRVMHRWAAEMELAAGIIHANSTGNDGTSNPRPLSLGVPSDCPPPAMTSSHYQQGGVSSMVAVAGYFSNGLFYTGSGVGPSAWSEQDICVHARSPWCGPDGSLIEYPEEFNDYPYYNGNHGLLKPDVTAPTVVDAVSLSCGCSSINGTSGATPHVGGALALIYSAFPGITPEDAYLALVNGALDAGDAGPDTTWGFGKLRLPPAIIHGNDTLGSVAGTVTASQGGAPLERVRVTVDGAQPVWTDGAGHYELYLRPGNYTAMFERYGYATVTRNVSIVAGEVDEGSLTMGLAANASITITVVDQDELTIPNVLVRHALSGESIYTDGNGQVEFETMFDGTQEFDIAFNIEVYMTTVHRVELSAGENSAEFRLTPSGSYGPTGPDAYGYFAYDDLDFGGPAYDWVELTEGLGTNLNLNDDACATRTLPFNMQFYGALSNSVCICANGNITVNTACNSDWGRWPIPNSAAPNNYIAVYYQDYRPQAGGGVWYYHDQANGRVIVQWDDVPEYFDLGRATFQAHIYDPAVESDERGNSIIEIHFADFSGRFDAATGIENSDGTVGLQYAFLQYYSAGATPIRAGRAVRFTTDVFTDAGDPPAPVPGEFALLQNYPNPFNSQTTFRFHVPQQSQVGLKLYNITGRQTATVFEGMRSAGLHSVSFDAAGLATGIYFARLEAHGRVVGAKKVLYLK